MATPPRHPLPPHGGHGPATGPAGPARPPACEICGAIPATHVVVRGHKGLLITLRFLTEEGTWCRTCGTAVQRRLSSATLWQGWWGLLSVFATPVTLVLNLRARSALRALPQPIGQLRPALDPGRRVLLRPPALVVVAVLLLALGAFTVPRLIPPHQVTFTAGDCGRNNAEWPEQDLEKTGCSSPDAEFWISRREDCQKTDMLLYLEYSSREEQLCAHAMTK